MSAAKIRTYCPLCISRCGAIATVEDGVLTKLEPDPQHPTGGGFCIKGRAAPEMVYSESRLTTPMRRVGPRGSGVRWEPVSWEDALDEVANRMELIRREQGPQAMVFGVTTPSGTAIADAFGWIHRLARAYGSPNVLFATENCNWHKDFSPQLTFGSGFGMPDLANTGCLLLWGANPAASWLALALEIKKAQKRGMKLVVIDPRGDGLARKADLWLRPMPGSDKALALALAGELLRLDAIDREFLRRWSNGPHLVRENTGEPLLRRGEPVAWNEDTGTPECMGTSGTDANWALEGSFQVTTESGIARCRPAFDLYAENCRAMSPEKAESLTCVPAQELRRAAALLAGNGPLALYTWTGLCQQADATQITRAVSLLYALSGDWDAPGGNVAFTRLPLNDIAGLDLLPRGSLDGTLGRVRRPLGPGRRGWISGADVTEALAQPSPPVKGILAFGGNWLATKPVPHAFPSLLEKLDFFAIAEMFFTPTARLADLILPAASPWEREGLCPGFGVSQRAESHLQLRPALVSPRGDSRPDSWIVFELARRLGVESAFFGGDREKALQHVLAPSGITPQQLRENPGGIDLALTTSHHKYRKAGFATGSGRLEIFSYELHRHGYAPIPRASESTRPDGFPLVLVSVKEVAYCHSQHRQLPSLRRRTPAPHVTLHPATALALGLEEDERAAVVTPNGRMAVQVRLDKNLAREVAVCTYGWHEDSQVDLAGLNPPGMVLNFAAIVDPNGCDPISGSDNLKAVPCRLEPL